MAGKPKKPKAPKKPKVTASLSAWENYHAKVAANNKKYAEALKDYNKKQALIKKARK